MPKLRSLNGEQVKNNREKSDKKQGAQPDNEGNTLKQRANPDKIVVHKIIGYCPCGTNLEVLPVKKIHRRQVFDLPEKLLEVTEHQVIKPAIKKRGRVAKTKSLNLLEAFINRPEEILRFVYDKEVPFDNNLAEGDLRMVKR